MSDKKKGVDKSKGKKPLLSETVKKRLISTLIILFFVITIGGYFAYVTGVPAKILTGVEIIETQANGKSKVLDRISVNELKYSYALMFKQYYQVGIVNDDTDLDSIMPGTQMTYAQFFYERAGENIRRNYLINAAAQKAGFKAESVESTIQYSVDAVRATAKNYNITADEYLMRTYGKGMTVKGYEKVLRSQLRADEYKEYLKQNDFWLTSEEMQAMYDANPYDFGLVTFNYYFFPATTDIAATDAEKKDAADAALKNANDVIAETADAASFRDACEKYAGEDKAAAFANGADPTRATDYSKETALYIGTEIADFLFAPGRVRGDKQVLVTETGAYAVYYDSVKFDTTPTYSYRVLSLENTAALDVDYQKTLDEAAAVTSRLETIKNSITDEKSFVAAVMKNSQDYATKPAGGLSSGIKYETYAVTQNPSDHDKALAVWLFSTDRKAGDMIIIPYDSYIHLYYYVDSIPAWQSSLRISNASDKLTGWIDSLGADGSVTYKINYDNIKFAGK